MAFFQSNESHVASTFKVGNFRFFLQVIFSHLSLTVVTLSSKIIELSNDFFMDYLQNGIPVRYFIDGEECSLIVYLFDYKNPENNSFVVANQ